MKNNINAENLGRIGEKIVVNYFSKKGCKIVESLNPFDSEKDMMIDDKKVEVKTQQPHILKKAITIRKNQLGKCISVDSLYFVTVPPKVKFLKCPYEWEGLLLEVDPKNFKYEEYTTKFGTQMIAIPLKQDAVKIIYRLSDEECFELGKYATSNY